eukprot:717780-Pyramimonas_sp.AAC.1
MRFLDVATNERQGREMARAIRGPADDDPKAREYYLNGSRCLSMHFFPASKSTGNQRACERPSGCEG